MAIIDWGANGGRVTDEPVAIRDVSYDPNHPTRPKLTMEVYDRTGARMAKMWTPSAEQASLVCEIGESCPPVMRISGLVTPGESKYGGEVTVDGVNPFGDGLPNEDFFVKPLPPEHAGWVRNLDRLIGLVRQPNLARLLDETVGSDGKFRKAYLDATAAKKKHHAYRGGLLCHSIQVANSAVREIVQHPGLLDPDLLVTAALLHDFGKLWEIEQCVWKQGEYTNSGDMLGHIFIGANHLTWLCKEYGMPGEMSRALMHAILAHHDDLEFGSPVRPMTAEAILIAKCDQISAELTGFGMLQAGNRPKKTVYAFNRKYYTGQGVSEPIPAPAEPLPDDPEERLLRRLTGIGGLGEERAYIGGSGAVFLPILGVVAAGDGIRSSSEEGDAEEREIIPPPTGADFLLRVIGDSMIGAGIVEGDLLLVRRQETARVGQIVVAMVPGVGPVVKRLTETGDHRFLSSENPLYAPILVTEGVCIQGVVVKVEREL